MWPHFYICKGGAFSLFPIFLLQVHFGSYLPNFKSNFNAIFCHFSRNSLQFCKNLTDILTHKWPHFSICRAGESGESSLLPTGTAHSTATQLSIEPVTMETTISANSEDSTAALLATIPNVPTQEPGGIIRKACKKAWKKIQNPMSWKMMKYFRCLWV